MTTKEKLLNKFGTIYQIAKASGEKYAHVYYKMRNNSPELENYLALEPTKKELITPGMQERIRLAIAKDYIRVNNFTKKHPEFSDSFVSQVLMGRRTRCTAKVRELLQVLGV